MKNFSSANYFVICNSEVCYKRLNIANNWLNFYWPTTKRISTLIMSISIKKLIALLQRFFCFNLFSIR